MTGRAVPGYQMQFVAMMESWEQLVKEHLVKKIGEDRRYRDIRQDVPGIKPVRRRSRSDRRTMPAPAIGDTKRVAADSAGF